MATMQPTGHATGSHHTPWERTIAHVILLLWALAATLIGLLLWSAAQADYLGGLPWYHPWALFGPATALIIIASVVLAYKRQRLGSIVLMIEGVAFSALGWIWFGFPSLPGIMGLLPLVPGYLLWDSARRESAGRGAV